MPVSGIVSRPRYDEPLMIDPAGQGHLVVADHAFEPDAASFAPVAPAAQVELWTALGDSRVAAGSQRNDNLIARNYRSAAQLLDALGHRLARERVGLRVYAVGAEAFIWDVAALARKNGMDKSEYRLSRAGPERRRVYCVHCRTFTQDVTINIVPCAGCGAHLAVRDHFSRRLAAFMGVQVDAETPGDIPSPVEAFS